MTHQALKTANSLHRLQTAEALCCPRHSQNKGRLRYANLSTISDLVHRAGEKAQAFSSNQVGNEDVRRLASEVADMAEAQLRLMEQLQRRPAGEGVPLGERERR